jgi:hypothetical protein
MMGFQVAAKSDSRDFTVDATVAFFGVPSKFLNALSGFASHIATIEASASGWH